MLITSQTARSQHYYIFDQYRNPHEKDITNKLLNYISDTVSAIKTLSEIEKKIQQEKNYKSAVGSYCRLYNVYDKLNNESGKMRCQFAIDSLAKIYKDSDASFMSIAITAESNIIHSKLSDAEKIITQNIDYFNKINNMQAAARLYSMLGMVYVEQQVPYLAMQNCFKAENCAKKNNDKKLLADIYYDIAKLYTLINETDEAEKYMIETHNIYFELEDFENMGITSVGLGTISEMKNDIPMANLYYKQALEKLIPFNNNFWIARAYNGIGKTIEIRGNKDEAHINYIISLKLRQKIGNEKELTDSYITLGKYYLNKNKLDSAEYFVQKAYDNARQGKDLRQKQSSARILSLIFKQKKDYANAFKYCEIAQIVQDSLNNNNNLKNITKMQMEHTFEQERKKNEVYRIEKESEIKAKNTTMLLSIIIIIIIFFISIIAIRQYIKQKKNNKKLQDQKHEIQERSLELEDKNIELSRLSFIANNTDNGIIIINNFYVTEWVNSSLIKHLWPNNNDKKKSDFERQPVKNIFGEEVLSSLKQCLDENKTVNFELLWKKNIWFQTTLSPYKEINGNIKIIAVLTDISQQKKAETEIIKQKQDIERKATLLSTYADELRTQKNTILEKNEELTRQSEILESNNKELEKLSIVAQQTDNSVFIANSKGEIQWINEAFERHSGYTIDEYLKLKKHNLLYASDYVDFPKVFETVKKEKKSQTYSYKSCTKDGHEMWMQTNLSPVVDSDGNIQSLIAVCSDVTQIKIAEQKIAEQNKEITDSIEYASRIQQALLPLPLFLNEVLKSYFIINLPKNIVSGDFHWIAHKNGYTIIAVADCTGHGIPGALMSMIGTVTLQNVIETSNNFSASEMLNKLRIKIIKLLHQRGKNNEAQDGMDISLIIHNTQNNTINYAGAYSFAYLLRFGTPDPQTLETADKSGSRITIGENNDAYLFSFKPDKMPIGIHARDHVPFSEIELKINSGDIIYLSSDGYCDQFGGPKCKKFFTTNFERMLLKNCKLSLNDQKEVLLSTFYEWKGDNEQVDDVHVLGIEL